MIENSISVTSLIEKYAQPFDSEFWAAYKTLEKLLEKEQWTTIRKQLFDTRKFDRQLLKDYGIDELTFNKEHQGLLDLWDEESRRSRQRGILIHQEIENSFYKKKKGISLSKYQIGGSFECQKDYIDLDLEFGIYPEYPLSVELGELRLLGRPDLTVKRGNELTIIDHKTDKKINTSGHFNSKIKAPSKMKFPLNHIIDCNFYHYALQLSTYAWMFKKINPQFIIKELIINHYDHNNKATLYKCDYMESDVEKMLNHYIREFNLTHKRDKRKRIEY